MNNELKSLSLAVILSFIAIYCVNQFFGVRTIPQPKNSSLTAEVPVQKNNVIELKNIKPKSVDEVIVEDKRITFENPSIKGSIRLKGARFDNLILKKYNVSTDNNTNKIDLLSPSKTKKPYFAELGWLSLDNSIKLPNTNTIWNTSDESFSATRPAILTWNNNEGIKIIRKISVDENYLFTITDTVENMSGEEIDIFPYALISRNLENSLQNRSVVHEGISAVLNGTLKEFRYTDIDENDEETFDAKTGWISFSDRYWFTALITPENKNKITFKNNGKNNYQIDYLGQRVVIPNGEASSYTYKLYSGAKEIKLLDKYTKENKITKFDLAVDFGWYYFLTKPFFYILDFLYGLLGNMGWAILLFAAILRLLMFPIANKSYTNMAKIKAIQPKMQEIREKYGNNQILIQQATMNLYKREKINPASGCLPMFIQIPIFFSLYKVLNIAIEIRHAPFIGWINDLSAPDPLTLSKILHFYIPSFLDIGLWPIFMGFTMWFQQKLNPAPTNSEQAKMFALMPVFFTFMLGQFASGLVIYWTLSNLLSIIQQRLIMKKNGVN